MDDMTKRQIDEYRSAFFAAHLRDSPPVSYHRGWFKIEGTGSNYRRGEIAAMTTRLQAQAER